MKRIDLNLLRIFVSIFEERTLTSASEQLGLTQPALSHALRRLRNIVGDELFLRTARGMNPTIRAEELYGRVRGHLSALEGSMEEEQGFDPASSTRSFTIAMSDYGMTVLLPTLIAHLQSTAPALKIQTRYYPHGAQYEDLFNGRSELSITVSGDHPDWCAETPLFQESAVGVAAIANEKIGKTPGLEEYLAARHVIMAPELGDRSWVDDHLEAIGHIRNVAHTVPHFFAIPAILEQTPFISTLPRRIAERLAAQYRIRLFELPFVAPTHKIVQVWHRRKTQDAGHKWLRARIKDQARHLF
jgi:DNA-binding transcriptional LysR family regulator